MRTFLSYPIQYSRFIVLPFALLSGCWTGVGNFGTVRPESTVPLLETGLPIWAGGRVPYVLDQSFLADSVHIRTVMEKWQQGTVVQFRRRVEGDTAYVLIRRGRCVTSSRGQVTVVSADPDCLGHELGHSLGLTHEHQRPDRDDYVTIKTPFWWLWGRSQYRVIPQRLCRPYDLSSIMHYNIAYIKPLPGNVISRRDNTVSPGDILSINQMYSGVPCSVSSGLAGAAK